MWDVPEDIRTHFPDWPGDVLEVEVYGPDFIRCPIWKNSFARQHLDKPARYKPDGRHEAFKAADRARYGLPDDEYVDVTMSWPLGVPQHIECYCQALKGDSQQTIYVEMTQLRDPTDEEKEGTSFFDEAASDPDIEEDVGSPPIYREHPRSMSRESFSARSSTGSFYTPFKSPKPRRKK